MSDAPMFTSGDILGKEIKKKKREKERSKLLNVADFGIFFSGFHYD